MSLSYPFGYWQEPLDEIPEKHLWDCDKCGAEITNYSKAKHKENSYITEFCGIDEIEEIELCESCHEHQLKSFETDH